MTILSSFTPSHPGSANVLLRLQDAVRNSPAPNLASPKDVAIDEIEGGHVVRMVGASPYQETGDERWFIQWVVQANPEQSWLHVDQADQPVLLEEGLVVVFDAGKSHRVETNSDGSQPHHVTVLIGTRLAFEPDQAQAELVLRDYLRENFPVAIEESVERRSPRP